MSENQAQSADQAAQAAAQAKADKDAAAQAKQAKADAKAVADKAKAEAKLIADQAKATAKAAADAAKAEAKAQKDAAVAAAKKAKEEAAALKAAEKAKQAETKTKTVMPSNNGVTRPRPEGACGKVWALADQLSSELGQAVPISNLIVATQAAGLNDATTRTQYARWKTYNGVFGVVAKVAAPAATQTAA
jgi:hypothetical protein